MRRLIKDLWYRYVAAPIWQAKRRIVLWRDRGFCRYCQDELTPNTFTVDHVVPRSAGGTNALKNLVACCKYCNKIKGNVTEVTREMRDYMWHRAFQRHQCNSARSRKTT